MGTSEEEGRVLALYLILSLPRECTLGRDLSRAPVSELCSSVSLSTSTAAEGGSGAHG